MRGTHERYRIALAAAALALGCSSSSFDGTSGKAASSASPQASVASSPAATSAGAAATGDSPSSTAAVGVDQPQDDPLATIDSACASNAEGGGIFGGIGMAVTPPSPPQPRTAPDDCRGGIEFNNFHGTFALASTASAGARAIRLEVDIATYEAPDRIRILARDASGQDTTILDTCRMKTSRYSDPTGGVQRPPDDSIRSFRPAVPAGTQSLVFDFSGSHTPQYMQVVGLCDFSTDPSGGAPNLRQVQSP